LVPLEVVEKMDPGMEKLLFLHLKQVVLLLRIRFFSFASTTRVPYDNPLIILLRAGKYDLFGLTSGGYSDNNK
jgi:hypothetical protein